MELSDFRSAESKFSCNNGPFKAQLVPKILYGLQVNYCILIHVTRNKCQQFTSCSFFLDVLVKFWTNYFLECASRQNYFYRLPLMSYLCVAVRKNHSNIHVYIRYTQVSRLLLLCICFCILI